MFCETLSLLDLIEKQIKVLRWILKLANYSNNTVSLLYMLSFNHVFDIWYHAVFDILFSIIVIINTLL